MEIKIDASDLLNQLDMLDERARKVDDLTVRDMKRRVPGAVSAATASVYRIKKSEVASCSAYAYDPHREREKCRKGPCSYQFPRHDDSLLCCSLQRQEACRVEDCPQETAQDKDNGP